MKIKIHPNFSAEKKYIIRVLVEVYLGLEYSLEFGEKHEYKITLKNGNSLIFTDDFFKYFSEKNNYLHEKNIPEHIRFVRSEFASLNDIPVIFGKGNVRAVHPPAPSKGGDERGVSSKGEHEHEVSFKERDERGVSSKQREASETFSEKTNTKAKNTSVSPFGGGWGVDCGIDIFASSFFMLSRWEELVNPVRDVHERFPAEASLAFRCDFLHRAVVNEYVELLWNMLIHLGVQQERKARNFSLVLTHDVDDKNYRWRYFQKKK